MPERTLAFLLAVAVAACNSPATPSAQSDGTSPTRPDPSAVGRLTVRADTGVAVVGRRLRVLVNANDASGAPIDASSAEVTASNTSVAQFFNAIAIPITVASTPNLNALSVTFDLTSAGSTAIRARLGILVDSIVISVIPP